jgi:phage terminase large subunit-like protein
MRIALLQMNSRTAARDENVRHACGLTNKWPGAVAKLIEDKANGSAVIQMLAREIPGLLPVNPQGGKVAPGPNGG